MHQPKILAISLVAVSPLTLGAISHENSGQEEFLPPRVTVGSGFLIKKHFGRVEGLGEICDVALGKLEGDERTHLIVSCYLGYALLNPVDGEERSRMPFERTFHLGPEDIGARSEALDVNGDGRLEFVRFAGTWLGNSSVHGADGKARWIHPNSKSLAPNLTVCGDLDGDGGLGFLMAYNATPEVHLLNAQGILIWKQEWTQLYDENVHFLDTDGNGKLEIVYVDGGALWVRDRDGKVLSRTTPPSGGYVNALAVLEGIGDPPETRLLVGSYVSGESQECQRYYEFTADGKKVIGDVTGQNLDAHIGVIPVRFAGDSRLFLARAAVQMRQASGAGFDASRLRLQVYDPDYQPVYDELIKSEDKDPVRGGGVFVIQSSDSSSGDRILAGYGSDLWEFSRAE